MTRRWTTFFAAAVLVVTTFVTGAGQQESIEELRARAEQGEADAQFYLGLIYGDGEGVPQDHAEAARWYRLAADQGNASAQYNLAIMYRVGRGVPQDEAEAVRSPRRVSWPEPKPSSNFRWGGEALGDTPPPCPTCSEGNT